MKVIGQDQVCTKSQMTKSGMSTGVKIEKNANKWLLLSAFSSKDMIGE